MAFHEVSWKIITYKHLGLGFFITQDEKLSFTNWVNNKICKMLVFSLNHNCCYHGKVWILICIRFRAFAWVTRLFRTKFLYISIALFHQLELSQDSQIHSLFLRQDFYTDFYTFMPKAFYTECYESMEQTWYRCTYTYLSFHKGLLYLIKPSEKKICNIFEKVGMKLLTRLSTHWLSIWVRTLFEIKFCCIAASRLKLLCTFFYTPNFQMQWGKSWWMT